MYFGIVKYSILLVSAISLLMVRSCCILNESNRKLEDEVKKEHKLWDFKVDVCADEDQSDKIQYCIFCFAIVLCIVNIKGGCLN